MTNKSRHKAQVNFNKFQIKSEVKTKQYQVKTNSNQNQDQLGSLQIPVKIQSQD